MAARRAVEYIELDVDWCDLVFGTHPCRASLSGIFTPDDTVAYQFDDGTSSVFGWSPTNATFVGGADYATWSGTGSDPIIQKTVSFTGAEVDTCRLNVRRTANGSTWDGSVYGFTASGWFRKTFSNVTINTDQTVIVDMSDATAGGGESGSWADKSFTSLRVDFDETGSGVIRVFSIELGTLETGNDRCFNTLFTCQDSARYTPGTVTLRFALDNGALSKDIYALPNIRNIAFSPATLAVGKDMGIRATLTVTLQDRPHSDTGPGFDKYHADRAYNPFDQGTLWGKLRARQPYLQNQVVRYVRGYSDQALVEMESRTFIVTKAQMSGMNGEFVIEAQDVLRLVDRTRSQAPVQNNGYLSADINNSVTSFTLSPTGIGDAEYAASGYLNLGGTEIVSFTRSGNTVTMTRGQLGTTAVAHSAQDRAQEVLYYVSEDPADIIYDLLLNYADVPSAWLDLATMQTETASYLQVNYTGIVGDPTSVEKLVSELCLQCALTIWWDDLNEVIRLQVLRGIISTVTVDDSNVINGTLTIEEQPEKRITQVWVYYGKIDPLESDDKPENYRSVAVQLDLEAESFYGSPSIMKIFSRWIPSGGRSVAERLGEIILGRFVDPPRMFKFEVLKRDQESPLIEMATGVDIASWALQLPNGAADTVQAQVVRYDPNTSRQRVEAEEFVFNTVSSFTDRTIIIEVNSYNVDLRTLYDSLYPSPDASTVVDIIVESGVIIGSTSTSQFAMTVGSWPTGCTLNMTVDGRIQGAGGAGGKGESPSGSGGTVGGDGGTAFYTRFPINIDGTGEIWGGGGGGGGGGSNFSGGGSGGGGGQGYAPGAGGAKGSGSTGTQVGSAGTTEAPGAGGVGSSSSGGADGGDGGAEAASGQTGEAGGKAGGAGGGAIDGDSYVTESGSLTVTGTRIN